MIDLAIIAVLSILLGVKFQVHYYVSAAAGLVVGFLFGGLSVIFNIIPVVFISFGAPLVYSFQSSLANLQPYLFSSGALVAGYLAGSLLSIVFLPVKLVSKILRTLANLL